MMGRRSPGRPCSRPPGTAPTPGGPARRSADPTWLINAADVHALYKEPADFAREIARIEAHLQAHPDDRDAWLILGAQWYFTGRTRKAADAFPRLPDRRPDETLAAFLAASK